MSERHQLTFSQASAALMKSALLWFKWRPIVNRAGKREMLYTNTLPAHFPVPAQLNCTSDITFEVTGMTKEGVRTIETPSVVVRSVSKK